MWMRSPCWPAPFANRGAAIAARWSSHPTTARTLTRLQVTAIMVKILRKTCIFSIAMGWTARRRRMELDRSDADAIRRLEEQLLESTVRISSRAVSNLLADDFVEFGSSGRIFNKQQIIESLQQEDGTCRRTMHDFQIRRLAPGVVLATYRACRDGGNGAVPVLSLRGSIWKQVDGRWQMVFHQGTLLTNP